MLITLTTAPTKADARQLAESIVTARLAACVQILPKMTSIYFWEGNVQKEEEHLLLIKTLPEKYAELEAFLQENHSYDTPEIVAIEASAVSEKYLGWLTGYLT